MKQTLNKLFSKASIGNYITLIGIIISVISSIVGITYWFATTVYNIERTTAVIQVQLSDLKSNCQDMQFRLNRVENKIDRLSGGKHHELDD